MIKLCHSDLYILESEKMTDHLTNTNYYLPSQISKIGLKKNDV